MKEIEDLKRKNLVTSGGQTGMGIGGIKKNIELNQIRDQVEINSAFQDLRSLKERSKGMVKIAQQINSKI